MRWRINGAAFWRKPELTFEDMQMICEGCGNVLLDGNCSCHMAVPDLKEQIKELGSRLESAQHEISKRIRLYEELRKERENDAGHLAKAWKERDAALLQVREANEENLTLRKTMDDVFLAIDEFFSSPEMKEILPPESFLAWKKQMELARESFVVKPAEQCGFNGGCSLPKGHHYGAHDAEKRVEPTSKDWHCAKCGKSMQFKDGLCMACFGGDPGQ